MDGRLAGLRRLVPLLASLCVVATGVAVAQVVAAAPPWQQSAGLLIALALATRVAVRIGRGEATFDLHPGELLIAFAVGIGFPPFPAAVVVTLHCLFLDAIGNRRRRIAFREDWQRRTKVIASAAANVLASIATWTVVLLATAVLPEGEPLSSLAVGLAAGLSYGLVNGFLLGSLVEWMVTGRWRTALGLVRGLVGPVVPQAATGSVLAVLAVRVHPLAALVALVAAWPLPALLRRHERLTESHTHVAHLIAMAADGGRGVSEAEVGEEVGGAVAGLLQYASGQVRAAPPVAPQELGAELPDGSWLVVREPINLEHPDPEDQPRLDGLAVIAGMLVESARERARHSDELETDPLTGLANRAGLRRAVDRLAPDGPLAVLFLDLNGFKPVNDTFGHDAGDRALVEISRRLRGQLRSVDIAARIGGDEFLLALPDLTDALVAEDVADRVARAVASPLAVAEGRHVKVETAVGIAMGPVHRFDALVTEADTAMFADKRNRSLGR